jgi:prepilin-type N-terminal cleavage/methylation domain-containing protein
MQVTATELRRSGVTLIEVLVAIFVASIGLLALLALFPVGALSMRQALKDSRCAQAGANAMALFKTLKLGQNSALNALNLLADPYSDQITALMPISASLGVRAGASANGASYPIFIDPLGATIKSVNTLGTNNHLPIYLDIQTNTYPRIPRAGVSFVTTLGGLGSYLPWFSLLDDIEFDPNNPGLPGPAGGSVNRDPRYTFAYMVRRPYAGNPSTFDVTVVAYAGRPLNTTMGSYEEIACNQVVFTQGSTQVTVPYGGNGQQPLRPPIKPGSWILDATMFDAAGNSNPQGYFYRVVDVIDNSTSLTLELQTAARQTTANGMLIFLDYVAEVFEKGTVSVQ